MHSATLRSPELNESTLPTVPTWVDRSAYPFQSRFLEVLPGASMHYVDDGAGDVVLFVHGTPPWSFEWRDAIRQTRMLDRWRSIVPAARVVELPVGHWPQEESPAKVARALRGFVEQPR